MNRVFGINPLPSGVGCHSERSGAGGGDDGSTGNTVGEVDLLDHADVLLVDHMVYQRAADIGCLAVVVRIG